MPLTGTYLIGQLELRTDSGSSMLTMALKKTDQAVEAASVGLVTVAAAADLRQGLKINRIGEPQCWTGGH